MAGMDTYAGRLAVRAEEQVGYALPWLCQPRSPPSLAPLTTFTRPAHRLYPPRSPPFSFHPPRAQSARMCGSTTCTFSTLSARWRRRSRRRMSLSSATSSRPSTLTAPSFCGGRPGTTPSLTRYAAPGNAAPRPPADLTADPHVCACTRWPGAARRRLQAAQPGRQPRRRIRGPGEQGPCEPLREGVRAREHARGGRAPALCHAEQRQPGRVARCGTGHRAPRPGDEGPCRRTDRPQLVCTHARTCTRRRGPMSTPWRRCAPPGRRRSP